MIKKLELSSLVCLVQNKISLTEEGELLAKKLISTHRLWEYFLIEILKMNEDQAHQQADLLEHITSQELYQALNTYLDYPELSPSGKQIYKNKNPQKS